MTNNILKNLLEITISPYLQKIHGLIGVKRSSGSNLFRHSWNVVGIITDYCQTLKNDTDWQIMLRTAICHDFLESKKDAKFTISENDITHIDSYGSKVVEMCKILTHDKSIESKEEYLARLIDAPYEILVVKLADRIDNLTDLHPGIFRLEKIERILNQTEKYILPIAKSVNDSFYKEINELIYSRRKMLSTIRYIEEYKNICSY